MPKIDWRSILTRNGIEYVEGGKSTARNNIYVKCRLCGAADEGYHMGISVHSRGFKGWACWKNDRHRGKSPVILLMILLDISSQQASDMLDDSKGMIEDKSLSGRLKHMLEPEKEKAANTPELRMPDEIKPLRKLTTETRMFYAYLESRGYKEEKVVPFLEKHYNLHYAIDGPFRYRLIFPIYTELGLTTWTGRVIVPGKEPRYLTLSTDPASKVSGARKPITDCLFDEKWLLKNESCAHTLILCEGPFDAMRMDYFGILYRINATCLFGKKVSEAQLETLKRLSSYYEQNFLLLDPDAELDTFAMWDKLANLGFKTVKLEKKYKDPAEMDFTGFEKMMKKLI